MTTKLTCNYIVQCLFIADSGLSINRQSNYLFSFSFQHPKVTLCKVAVPFHQWSICLSDCSSHTRKVRRGQLLNKKSFTSHAHHNKVYHTFCIITQNLVNEEATVYLLKFLRKTPVNSEIFFYHALR